MTENLVQVTEAERMVPNTLVLLLSGLALALDLMLGPYALRWMGINYASNGGGAATKVHPGTYVTILAIAIYLITSDHPLRALAKSVRTQPALAFYCASMAILSAYVLWLKELGTVPLILDTYLAPGLLMLLLAEAPSDFLRALTAWMIGLILFNAVCGIGEAKMSARLFPYVSDNIEIHEEYFRATAFAGHPLRNASVTALGALAVAAADWGWRTRASLLGILFLGMLAFGGRTALVVAFLGCMAIGAWELSSRTRRDQSVFVPAALMTGTGLVAAGVAISSIFALTRFGERIRSEELAGSSSMSRWQLFHIFDMTDWNTLVGGYPAASIDTMARMLNLEGGIENFWVYMLMFLGFAGYAVWLPAFLAAQRFLWRMSGFGGRVLLLAFLVMATSNNGIAKKGTLMSIAAGMILGVRCFQREHEASAASPSMLGNAAYSS
jgi:hypothetical protein